MNGARNRSGRLGFLEFIQVFSLDVILASLALSAMLNHVTNTSVQPIYWVVIALAIWSVYTADHLVDASIAGNRAATLRHRVHLRQRGILTFLMSLAALSSLGLAIAFLPSELILRGVWLAVGASVYFVSLLFFSNPHRPYFFKEPLVALIFTLGIWLAPFGSRLSWPEFALWLLPVMYLTVLSNLLLNSVLETDEDKHSGFSSLGLRLGSRYSHFLMASSAVLSILAVSFLRFNGAGDKLFIAGLCLSFIQILYILLFTQMKRLKNSTIRFVGDIIFLICFITLL